MIKGKNKTKVNSGGGGVGRVFVIVIKIPYSPKGFFPNLEKGGEIKFGDAPPSFRTDILVRQKKTRCTRINLDVSAAESKRTQANQGEKKGASACWHAHHQRM